MLIVASRRAFCNYYLTIRPHGVQNRGRLERLASGLDAGEWCDFPTDRSDDMPDTSRFRRWIVRAACVALLLPAVARAQPEHGLLFFKDGFVIEGEIKREANFMVDHGEGVVIPKGPFFLDDGPRLLFFSPSLIRIIEKRQLQYGDTLNNPMNLLGGKKLGQPVLGVVGTKPWNDKWDRTITIQTPARQIDLDQHLGFLSPYWARLDVSRDRNLFWSASYLTSEFPADELLTLVSTHPKLTEKTGLAEKDLVDRRFRVAQFLVQCGHYDVAERELKRIVNNFPGQEKPVDTALEALERARTRDRHENLKRLLASGQTRAAKRALDDFPLKSATETIQADVLDLRNEFASAETKLAEIKRFLTDLPKTVIEAKYRPLVDAATALKAELEVETSSRLEVFLTQAKQAEKQKENGKTPEVSPPELLALAVSGWLLGGTSAETKPETAIRLWKTRQVVLEYQKTTDVRTRAVLLSTFGRETGDTRFDEVMQIIPTLPPPEPETNLSSENPVAQTPPGMGASQYLVKVPREYRHSRTYPVLIVLHEAGESPSAALDRWSGPACEQGFIVVAPKWQNGLGGYTYSEREHAAVLGTLRDLRRKYNVDSDRVFLFGLGQGATMAFDVGLSHPDEFAGIIPMGAGPDYFAKQYQRNSQYLPFYIVTGNLSGDTLRNLSKTMEDWTMRGFPTLWVNYKGRGIEWFAGEVPNILDWMRSKRRAFPLRQLGTDGLGGKHGNEFRTQRSTDNRFYWISTDAVDPKRINSPPPLEWSWQKEPATVYARIDPAHNEIFIEQFGLKQVSIWLGRNSRGESMIDFDKPVTIRVHFTVKWNNKPIKPSLDTLLEDLYQRGDRQRLFLAKVDLAL
jgi:pimeloyl-ACP methyl ester carboxylesterase